MSDIDDPLAPSIEIARAELEPDLQSSLGAATTAGALSLIYGIVSAVQSLLAGKAQDRIVTRYIQFFQDMAARVNEIRGSIPDNKYYASEEFQTLLALSYEQLLTTHDRAKLKMLAAALANSGAAACEGDPNKDRYLRAFRDIDVRDVHMLQEDRFRQYQEPIHAATYEIGDLPCLSRLVSMGLLNEQRYTGFGGGSVIGQDRAFWLSDFGRSFLNFISSESGRE